MKSNQHWFTLIEILTWVLIAGIVMTSWFYALNLITLSRIKLIEETEITREAFYLSQKLFEEIKAWGTLDYEEYFNRRIVNMSAGTNVWSWHFIKPTWFWNFGVWWTVGNSTYWAQEFYYCTSDWLWFSLTWWCVTLNSRFGWLISNPLNVNYSGIPQRYGQYKYQFIDFRGDQNTNGDIRGDQDDEHMGSGPIAFTGWQNVTELYLISGDGKKRTFFRWNVKQDPNAPWITCNGADPTGSGCLWNIEMLRLTGEDMWFNHDGASLWAYDGIVDTWRVERAFAGWVDVVAGSDTSNYWQEFFSDGISVKDFKVFAYPNIDTKNAWKVTAESQNVNPYVRINMTLVPSWRKRAQMKWELPEIKISTTINLVEYFSQ